MAKRNETTGVNTTKVQTLTDEEVRKLSQVGTDLGANNQTLTIASNSVFTGNVNVASDLTLGGKLNANGPVAFSALSLSGPATATSLTLTQGLQVGGLANLQNGLTVNGLTAVNGTLTVSGRASVGALTTDSIAARSISLSGPFVIGHITTQGPPVTAAAGTAVGNGGTVSASGNDTAGTVTINPGTGAGVGTLVSVTFRAAYGATVRVALTPLTPGAAQTNVYVVRTANGFTVNAANVPTGGVLSFDYIITQ
jgi:hypothetical protein